MGMGMEMGMDMVAVGRERGYKRGLCSFIQCVRHLFHEIIQYGKG